MTKSIQKFKMIGVDVAKQKLDIALDAQMLFTVDNLEAGFKQVLKRVADLQSVCFVLESTGGYEKRFVAFLQAQKVAVSVVNAKRVRDYAKAIGQHAKNDRIDAQMIRQYAEMVQPKPREKSTADVLQLDALTKRRDQLVKQRAVEKQGVGSGKQSGDRAVNQKNHQSI